MVAMVDKNKTANFASRLLGWRIWIQAAFLVVWLDPAGLRMHTMCSPVFHCYACPLATFACPIGVIAQFGALHVFPFIAVGLLIAVGALFGTLICGWACPFGFLQDLTGKVPTPKFDLPKITGYLRYVVLIGTVLAVPYFFGEEHPLFVCRICPAGALEAAVPTMAGQAIAGKGVQAILTGNCGPNAHQVLSSSGIQIITGVSGKVREAIQDYKSGKFQTSAQANVPDHFGMGMGRGMGGGMGRGMGMGRGRGMSRG